jgi:hypothetical protein
MIDRNLGNAERLVRFSMGLAFAGWAFSQPYLNGIFSRCYLWYVLELDTAHQSKDDSAKTSGADYPV